MDTCAICGKDDDAPKNSVSEKGLNSMLKACKQKGNSDLESQLKQLANDETQITVHINCRKRLIDLRTVEHQVPSKKLRSSNAHIFNWKTDCFFCDKLCDKRRGNFSEATTLPLRNKVIDHARRRTDDWGRKVLSRMEGCVDLVAEEAVYHASCMAEFCLNEKNVHVSVGRPADKDMVEAFEQFCDYFESALDCEAYSITELYQKISEFNKNCYSLRSFREKLKHRYKDYIYFVKGEGRQSELVCFKNMADYFLREMKKNPSTKENVLISAAKIIKADIRNLNLSKN